MSTLQTYNLKHPDASGNQITFTSGGDVNFDNGAVYLDSTNNRLGVGTSSPSGNLDVRGLSGTTIISAVGVDSNGFADVEILSTGTTGSSRLYFSDTAAKSGSIVYSHSNNSFAFATNGGSSDVFIDSSGNLGIGTATVADVLHVQTNATGRLLIGPNGASIYHNKIYNDNGDLMISSEGSASDMIVGSTRDIIFRTDGVAGTDEAARFKEDGTLLVNTTSSPTAAISPKVVVNGNTLTKAGSATIDNTFTSITGATVGNETSVYLVTIRAIGDGNFYSTGTFILNSAAYSKTFTQLGSSSNHFGNGYLLAQLSSSSTTSASIQVRRSNAGAATCHVHMLRLM